MEKNHNSLIRVGAVSALGQAAWWIGWYGPEHPLAILVAIASTCGVIGGACWLYARWQSGGYKRQSVREKIPSGTIGKIGGNDGGATASRS